MASDRVAISAGGKDFVTSLSTLKSSGAGYFEALLGPTGSSMRKGRKRARADDDEPPRELFVDRDPDLFTDVLAFMRSGRIPAATRTDAARLEDLKDEAEFFAYDDLATACTEAVDALVAALEAMTPPAPVARSLDCTNVPCNSNTPLTIPVPKGQVLFLASATIAGPGSLAHRYVKTKEQKEDETAVGSYLTFSGEQHSPDFQLLAGHPDLPISNVVLAHVAMDHFRTDGEHGLHVDFRQDLRICLSGDSNNQVHFTARGPADCNWSLAIWVGHANAIPGLTQRPAAPPTRAVPRTHRREDDEDDSFTTMMLATMLARQRSAARTNLAAMAAIAHLAARR